MTTETSQRVQQEALFPIASNTATTLTNTDRPASSSGTTSTRRPVGRPRKQHPPLTQEQWTLVLDHLWLPRVVARETRFDYALLEREDRAQEGVFGLVNASRKYPSGAGFKFSTFARRHVRGAIMRAVVNYNQIRIPEYALENGAPPQGAPIVDASLDRMFGWASEHEGGGLPEPRELGIEYVGGQFVMRASLLALDLLETIEAG